ncbi:MAG: hypothetical protein ACRDOA_24305 [Streptosporangiaceae bacterium]
MLRWMTPRLAQAARQETAAQSAALALAAKRAHGQSRRAHGKLKHAHGHARQDQALAPAPG